MKTCLSFLAALSALLGSSGCIVSQGADQGKLPPDWIAAMPKSGSPVVSLAGVYVELGEILDEKFTRNGTVNRANLSKFLSPKLLDAGPTWQPGDRAATNELRSVDETHVELITRIDDNVTSRVMLEVEFEKATGTTVLHYSRSIAHIVAAGHLATTLRLWRAADGDLYLHVTGRYVGEMLLVPGVSSSEMWCRWEPATPAALEKQTAVLINHDRAGQRAAELNRSRVKVGAKAPAIQGVDALTGRSVTSADYEGKVVVLHAWSTTNGSRVLASVREAREKYRGRGLDTIGLCTNPANEQVKIADYIRANHLTWPQLYDGKETHGEIYETCFGTLAGPYCVIDRHGKVAAMVWAANRLDDAIATALDAP